MTMQPGWVPPDVDTGKANIARVYDWWLGGDHNFRADQDAARAMIAIEPNARAIARENRAFLGRAVRFLAAEAGIRQFLDIGSGIPTQNNVHEVARDAACSDPRPEILSAFETTYKSKVAAQGRARTRAEIARFFDGCTLIEPGLVWVPQWRPDQPQDVPDDPEKYWFLAGVGAT